MGEKNGILEFAETLIVEKTATYCSELQRRILMAALQGERKTYDQLAEECGYSPKYVKQDVAPKLWHLISQALEQKVTKSNVRAVLEQEMRNGTQSRSITDSKPVQPAIGFSAGHFGTVSSPSVTAVTSATPPIPETNPIAKANILLVDDRPKNLRLLTDLLEEQGYEVQQAINGEVALQAVTLVHPDLILLDINMPGMDGYTVCQQLKAEPSTRDIPVIFISALDEAWDKVKAFSAGGNDYIAKPFKVVEVLARVENQLKIQQLQRQLKDQNAQLLHAIQELQRLAALDELTQVATRRRFDAYLLERWQQAMQTQTPLTLLLCQLDNFHFYGEEGRHATGDLVLKHIAELIKQTVQGPNDLVSRFGTLTFAILLPNLDTSEVQKTAQTLLQRVKSLKVSGEMLGLTLSLGMITVLPTPNTGLEQFLEACDLNLQQAKSKGGNCVVGS